MELSFIFYFLCCVDNNVYCEQKENCSLFYSSITFLQYKIMYHFHPINNLVLTHVHVARANVKLSCVVLFLKSVRIFDQALTCLPAFWGKVIKNAKTSLYITSCVFYQASQNSTKIIDSACWKLGWRIKDQKKKGESENATETIKKFCWRVVLYGRERI